MRLLDLHILGFGKFHDTTLTFQDGLNLVYGKNEAGKSTIHTFIRSMLFGMERQRGRAARNDTYSRYEPWENSGTYEGRLRLESDGTIYRIERSFQRNKKEFTVINESAGREESDPRAVLDEILGGISETAYNNTISISQLKSATEEGMISELKNYIANMNTSGNMALNITKATAYLKNQKKQLEAQLSPEAARTYASLLSEIRSLEQELSSPQYENQLQEYARLRESVRAELEVCQQEKEELEEKLRQGQAVLEEYDFRDEASVQDYLRNAEEIEKEYRESLAVSSGTAGRVLPPVFYALAALLAAGGGMLLFRALHPAGAAALSLPLNLTAAPAAAILGGLAALFLAAGVLLTLRRRRHRKAARLCAATLSEIFRRHLGCGDLGDTSMDALRERLQEFIRLCRSMAQCGQDLREKTEQLTALLARQNDCSEVIEAQQHIQWELDKKLEHLADCKDRALALRQIIRENEQIRQDIAAIDLARETMQDLSMSIRDSFGLYLNKTASQLINGITGGVYSSMSIDENLNAFLNTSRRLIPLEQVSSGTADQIYLALRLAAARFIQGDRERLPLIFDDSFVLYDDERLKTALRWLPEAYRGQIIIFTCHRREERILREAEIPFHSISIADGL